MAGNYMIQLKTRCGCTQLLAVPYHPGPEYHVPLGPKPGTFIACEPGIDMMQPFVPERRTFQYRKATALLHRDVVLTYEEV